MILAGYWYLSMDSAVGVTWYTCVNTIARTLGNILFLIKEDLADMNKEYMLPIHLKMNASQKTNDSSTHIKTSCHFLCRHP
jgi:hypothetical protein